MGFYSGQGRVYVASAVAGVPGAFRYVGNCPILNVALETDILDHKESTSGQRLTDLRIIRGKSSKFSFTLEDWNKDNLALALYGAASTISGSTVSAEIAPATFAVGDYWRLVHPDVTSLVVTDSAGTPATLTLGTHYEITSAKHGTVKILNLGSFTQPFKAAYTYASRSNINMLTQGFVDRWVKFDGLNTVDSNRQVVVDLYKVNFDPIAQMDLINDDIFKMELSGGALYDSTKESDATLGQFGRVQLIT
jgi:hypothetical protein